MIETSMWDMNPVVMVFGIVHAFWTLMQESKSLKFQTNTFSLIFWIESFMEEIQALVREKKKIEEMSQLKQKALHDYFGLSIF